jgi:hypothetical protein
LEVQLLIFAALTIGSETTGSRRPADDEGVILAMNATTTLIAAGIARDVAGMAMPYARPRITAVSALSSVSTSAHCASLAGMADLWAAKKGHPSVPRGGPA